MAKLPGGELATRPLHLIWIADCSGSMSLDGKIQALNSAIRESLPHMRGVADENPHARLLVRALKFSHGAAWHVPEPTPVQEFEWGELVADPLQKSGVAADIVFMIDTSGSMGDEIEAVKSSCMSFADRIVEEGADVRLGLVGFDIGGHRDGSTEAYNVRNLSTYTIGVWPLTSPEKFKQSVSSLSVGLFGGGGCYLANETTVDIFPHVVRAFDERRENARTLVIISDEMGDTGGLSEIVSRLKKASITAHVLGVRGEVGAHESIARMTGGNFWDIFESRGRHDFGDLLETVAIAIAKELTRSLADGTQSAGTDMGTALRTVADQLKMPPMSERALPPVLVLISDGQPTDDFDSGLKALMDQPWGKKAVRTAVAIGKDADLDVLQRFIGHEELKPLQANNPEALVRHMKWVSTAVLKSASSPATQPAGPESPQINVPIPQPVDTSEGPSAADDLW